MLMRTHFLPLLLLGLWLTAACTHRPPSYKQEYTDVVYDNACAKGFHIWGARDRQSTVIEVTNPWQNARDVTMAYFVARGGEQPPEDFDGVVIPAGPRRIVCMSSSYVGMLDALGATDRVVGVSGLDYINSPALLARRDSVRDVGAELDFEVLLGLKPDLVLLYGVDDAQTAVTDKLTELGIPYMYIGEYVEEDPIGRAEWMMVLAEVLGLQKRCQLMIDILYTQYKTLSQLVADVKERPQVMLNTPWNDVWTLPSPESYMARLIHDAGGEYIFREGAAGSYTRIGMETAYSLLHEADYWLNISSVKTLDELKAMDPQFASAKAVREGHVFNNNLRTNAAGGNDFWESSVVKPSRVLLDLICILHPEKRRATDTLYYYRPIVPATGADTPPSR